MLFFFRMPSLTRLTVALNWTVREKRKRRRLVKRTKPKSLSLPRMRRRRKKINVTVSSLFAQSFTQHQLFH